MVPVFRMYKVTLVDERKEYESMLRASRYWRTDTAICSECESVPEVPVTVTT